VGRNVAYLCLLLIGALKSRVYVQEKQAVEKSDPAGECPARKRIISRGTRREINQSILIPIYPAPDLLSRHPRMSVFI
jgi:hypothetical protein